MTNIEAAIGLAQLEKIDYHLEARTSVAEWYTARLQGLQDTIMLPQPEKDVHHSFWMYAIEFQSSAGIDRDAVISEMAERNIETRPGFYPAHTMPPYFDPNVRTSVASESGPNAMFANACTPFRNRCRARSNATARSHRTLKAGFSVQSVIDSLAIPQI